MTGKVQDIPEPPPPISADQVFVGTVVTEQNSAAPPGGGPAVEFLPLRVVGEGGMGIVYRALQRYPEAAW